MTTEYKLPKAAVRACASVYDDHEPYYTADQMQQAYQSGRDAMREEVAKFCDDSEYPDGSDLAYYIRKQLK